MSERGAVSLGEEDGTWGCFESSGRAVPEEPDGIRTDFQRDRDRILHSKSFRRLMHKTQVFISPDGDHFRTRLTHTLEVMQISRTIARSLELNEDLTEAIALGHDLGHTPFGHTGETALNAVVSEYGREFRHNHHSLRVVEHLERDGRGLNLTPEVRDGILNHTGSGMPSTREGEIVRTADRIAYVNHDVDDALRAGIISLESLPENSLSVLGSTTKTRIDTLVRDMISTSRDVGGIALSAEVYDALMELRSWLFVNVYQRPLTRQNEKAAGVVRSLFAHYYRIHELEREDPVRSTTDFVAGMTDRFAIAAYRDVFLPKGDIFA